MSTWHIAGCHHSTAPLPSPIAQSRIASHRSAPPASSRALSERGKGSLCARRAAGGALVVSTVKRRRPHFRVSEPCQPHPALILAYLVRPQAPPTPHSRVLDHRRPSNCWTIRPHLPSRLSDSIAIACSVVRLPHPTRCSTTVSCRLPSARNGAAQHHATTLTTPRTRPSLDGTPRAAMSAEPAMPAPVTTTLPAPDKPSTFNGTGMLSSRRRPRLLR